MPFKMLPGKFYRMPVNFGQSLGPRQRGSDQVLFSEHGPKATNIAVYFRTNKKKLEALLPERFVMASDPIACVRATYLKEIPWLAGRGYNHMGLTIPATFKGKKDLVTGEYLTVLWENLCDPIITGREDLGYPKIYCELPEPVVHAGKMHCTASWLGFKFMDLHISNLREATAKEIGQFSNPESEGVLTYKYMPRTGEWGTADTEYVTLTPFKDPYKKVTELWMGDGSVQFHKATWEELPTLYNIVNVLSALKATEWLGITIVKTVGAKDYSDQRILM